MNHDARGDPDAVERFRQIYTRNYSHLVGYALRRTDSSDDAADIVAETFLVAWRDLARVPAGDAATPWLYGIAKGVLANQRRGARRRSRLAQRLGMELRTSVQPAWVESTDRIALADAFAALSESDREVLSLSAWEGLGPEALAVALGCSSGAAKVRLSRARARFTKALAHRNQAGGPTPQHPSAPMTSMEGSHDT